LAPTVPHPGGGAPRRDDDAFRDAVPPTVTVPPPNSSSNRTPVARVTRALSVLVVTCAVALCATPVSTAAIVRPDSGAWWGAFVKKQDGLTHEQTVVRMEQRLGRKLKINHHYHEWNSLDLREERHDLAAGRIPLISWPSAAWPAGVDAQAINSGSQDGVIRRAADDLRELGAPVFLRFAFEMDQKPPSRRHIGKPRPFKRAWRHVYRIMRARGADNVQFVWCAVASNFASGRAQHFYPGDDYVQWIAADGFSFYPVKLSSISRWRSFAEIFGAFYQWGAPRSRPLMVAATGVQEDRQRPRRKAHWFQNASEALRNRMDQIEAFVYWSALHPTPNGNANFRVATSWRSFRAYRAMGDLPYFRP
jgi:hypothetical protein